MTELEKLILYWKTYLVRHPITYEFELQDKIKETIPYLDELNDLTYHQ
ncbi:hypothetical protein ES705_27319 [subsurface metagenome]